MTTLTLSQIKKAVLDGLTHVSAHFAKDPTPTDGSVRAGMAIAAGSSTRAMTKKKKPATPKRQKRR